MFRIACGIVDVDYLWACDIIMLDVLACGIVDGQLVNATVLRPRCNNVVGCRCTCLLHELRDARDIAAMHVFALSSAHVAIDSYCCVVCFHSTQECRGCRCRVRNLMVNVVRLENHANINNNTTALTPYTIIYSIAKYEVVRLNRLKQPPVPCR